VPFGNHDDFNLYAYVYNDPTDRGDTTGFDGTLFGFVPTQIAEIAAAQQAKVQARNADTLGTRAAFSYDNRQMMMRGGSGVAAATAVGVTRDYAGSGTRFGGPCA